MGNICKKYEILYTGVNIFRKEKQTLNLCNVVLGEECRGTGWAFHLIPSSYDFNYGHVSLLRLNMY